MLDTPLKKNKGILYLNLHLKESVVIRIFTFIKDQEIYVLLYPIAKMTLYNNFKEV